jgi:hypothetical protein
VLRSIPKSAVLTQRREDFFDRLQSTITRGYKRQWRPILREQFPQGGKPLTEAVQKKADEEARKHMKKLERALDSVIQKK